MPECAPRSEGARAVGEEKPTGSAWINCNFRDLGRRVSSMSAITFIPEATIAAGEEGIARFTRVMFHHPLLSRFRPRMHIATINSAAGAIGKEEPAGIAWVICIQPDLSRSIPSMPERASISEITSPIREKVPTWLARVMFQHPVFCWWSSSMPKSTSISKGAGKIGEDIPAGFA